MFEETYSLSDWIGAASRQGELRFEFTAGATDDDDDDDDDWTRSLMTLTEIAIEPKSKRTTRLGNGQ